MIKINKILAVISIEQVKSKLSKRNVVIGIVAAIGVATGAVSISDPESISTLADKAFAILNMFN